jgi:fumarate hydratase class II
MTSSGSRPLPGVYRLALGGTAVGTGLNGPTRFRRSRGGPVLGDLLRIRLCALDQHSENCAPALARETTPMSAALGHRALAVDD